MYIFADQWTIQPCACPLAGVCLSQLVWRLLIWECKDVLNDVIEQFESYFKPSQSTFQSWYELGSLYSFQFKNQNDFLNKLLDVSKDCELDNPNELVKFLFLVHNQNSHACENLLKELKSNSTLQDCQTN